MGMEVFIRQLQIRDDTSLVDVLRNNAFHVFRLHMAIVDFVRVDGDDRSLLAQAEASGLNDLDFIFQAIALQRFNKVVVDLS